jgi:hypothetical protein
LDTAKEYDRVDRRFVGMYFIEVGLS